MKKTVLILAAAFIVAAIPFFAGGCGQKGTRGTGGQMEISIAFWWMAEGGGVFGSDPIGQFIENKFNVKIIPVNIEWGDYLEQYRLWAASDQLPDVMADYPPTSTVFKDFIDQGLIRSIPYEMISQYP